MNRAAEKLAMVKRWRRTHKVSAGVSIRTLYHWDRKYWLGGIEALQDGRTTRPRRGSRFHEFIKLVGTKLPATRGKVATAYRLAAEVATVPVPSLKTIQRAFAGPSKPRRPARNGRGKSKQKQARR